MKNNISNYLLVLIFFISGCSTSKTPMTKGPEKSYEKALNNLKKGKSLEKNKALFSKTELAPKFYK